MATPASNPARVHHFLPKFYSKRWANRDGLVYRFTRHPGGVVDRLVPPTRVGWALNLYQMPGEDGPDAQRLEERYFARLDGAASVALDKLLSDPPQHLSDVDGGAWATFTMSLFHRSPVYLDEMKRFGVRMWRDALVRLEADYDKHRQPADPPTYAEYAAGRSDVEGEQATMLNIPHLFSTPRLMAFMSNAPWVQFAVPATERPLLLSDTPALMTNGLDTPGGHLAIPLSPRRVLIMARDMDTARSMDRVPIRHMVKTLNTAAVQRARHCVVASDLTQAAFIRKHMGTKPINSPLIRADQA